MFLMVFGNNWGLQHRGRYIRLDFAENKNNIENCQPSPLTPKSIKIRHYIIFSIMYAPENTDSRWPVWSKEDRWRWRSKTRSVAQSVVYIWLLICAHHNHHNHNQSCCSGTCCCCTVPPFFRDLWGYKEEYTHTHTHTHTRTHTHTQRL